MDDLRNLIIGRMRIDQDAAELRELLASLLRDHDRSPLVEFVRRLLALDGPGVGEWLQQTPLHREAALRVWMLAGRVSLGQALAAVCDDALGQKNASEEEDEA
jgi:hypothetical protein